MSYPKFLDEEIEKCIRETLALSIVSTNADTKIIKEHLDLVKEIEITEDQKKRFVQEFLYPCHALVKMVKNGDPTIRHFMESFYLHEYSTINEIVTAFMFFKINENYFLDEADPTDFEQKVEYSKKQIKSAWEIVKQYFGSNGKFWAKGWRKLADLSKTSQDIKDLLGKDKLSQVEAKKLKQWKLKSIKTFGVVFITGTIIVLAAGLLMRRYERHKCVHTVGEVRTRCLIDGVNATLKALKEGERKCDGAKDPEKCRNIVRKKQAKMEQRKRSLEMKLREQKR